MIILYIMQTVVPLALIAWLFFVPPRSTIAFWTQAISIGIGIVALAMTGLLLFPPWWAPWAFGVLLIVAIFASLRRQPLTTHIPYSASAWIVTIAFGSAALFFANQIHLAYEGAQSPAGPTVYLASPLGPGRFLIINGGATTALNAHADALDQSVPAHRAFYGTAYGIDIVAINRFGLRTNGIMPTDPQRYRIFGMPVVSPCAGTVIAAIDGLADMDVPELDEKNIAGNHVMMRCGKFDVLLAHFQQGSVRVKLGEKIAIGTFLAKVGNSGATSEPHLHIHAQRPGTETAPFSGQPIPSRIEQHFWTRNERFHGKLSHVGD